MTLWPIFEFITAFGMGVGLGSWDLIRIKAGVPTQSPNRRSRVILQALGIVMLALVGFTNYEQHRYSNCQQGRNQVFSDGIAARAAAQQAFSEADMVFTVADERWVADQIRVLDAARNPNLLSPAERDRLTDEWRQSLVIKQQSALAKEQALRVLAQSRTDNPVNSPQGC